MTTLRQEHVLVTGGAGFIGSHIVEGLLQRGLRVTVLDNFCTGKIENLENLCDGKAKLGKDFQVVNGDIRDSSVLNAVVKKVDAILHQAALGSVPRSVEDPWTTHTVNADGTLNVFLAARKNHVQRVVYASSSSVYGDAETLPKQEGKEGVALSPYALTKQINEHYSRLFFDLYGLETLGLRYFNVYGARQDPASEYAAVIPRFVTALLKGEPPVIYGTGEQTRDFTYVKDVVEANIAALEAPHEACGQAYNIGAGCRTSLLELLSVLQDLLGSKVQAVHAAPRPGDVMHSMADTSRASAILGFSARTSLKEGLAQSIEWYRTCYSQV
jgi:nucleoside-diphosphate-sugar epimerase